MPYLELFRSPRSMEGLLKSPLNVATRNPLTLYQIILTSLIYLDIVVLVLEYMKRIC